MKASRLRQPSANNAEAVVPAQSSTPPSASAFAPGDTGDTITVTNTSALKRRQKVIAQAPHRDASVLHVYQTIWYCQWPEDSGSQSDPASYAGIDPPPPNPPLIKPAGDSQIPSIL
jgi:hypothetical protein